MELHPAACLKVGSYSFADAKTRAYSHVPSARLRTTSLLLVVGHGNDKVHGSVPVETSRNGAATQELVTRDGIEPSTYGLRVPG